MKISYIKIAKLSPYKRIRQYECKGDYHDEAEDIKH